VLEDDGKELDIYKPKNESKIDIELRAFEVATYRLQL
jgi:hypothetical protein